MLKPHLLLFLHVRMIHFRPKGLFLSAAKCFMSEMYTPYLQACYFSFEVKATI